MLGSIATYFFEKEKQKRLGKGQRAKVEFFPDRKNHYGLLVDASNPDDRAIIITFAEELRRDGNRVKILGYLDGKQEKNSVSFDAFNSTELSRISKVPKSPVAESFMDQPFDVLINLSIRQNHKALEYICSVSRASFRVGPWYAGQQNNPYDLCVDANSSTSLKEWLSELMHTLQKIH